MLKIVELVEIMPGVENEFYAIADYQKVQDRLWDWLTNSIYFNYQCKFRYKRGRVSTEIMQEYGSPKINSDLIGIFPPLICDYRLNVITKGGYCGLKSENLLPLKPCFSSPNCIKFTRF